MTGTITTKRGTTYIFRDDHAHETGIIYAWDIHDPMTAGRTKTHKWKRMPKGFITKFDLDKPPYTVSYLPILC